jgi:hypothetical protein
MIDILVDNLLSGNMSSIDFMDECKNLGKNSKKISEPENVVLLFIKSHIEECRYGSGMHLEFIKIFINLIGPNIICKKYTKENYGVFTLLDTAMRLTNNNNYVYFILRTNDCKYSYEIPYSSIQYKIDIKEYMSHIFSNFYCDSTITLREYIDIYKREKINLYQEDNIIEFFFCACDSADEDTIKMLLNEFGKNTFDPNSTMSIGRLMTILDYIDVFRDQIYPGKVKEKWLYETLRKLGCKHSYEMDQNELHESLGKNKSLEKYLPITKEELHSLKIAKMEDSLEETYDWDMFDF